ncbi:MAG: T9SS type A sorting domain-containing protein [Saprospiraceae bacterium]|nr:T9SS type A sorting domain-containing protein [Saprospiraceae bacterium]
MKEIYIKKLVLFCCFLLLGIGFTSAQNHTLTVTGGAAPASYQLTISQVGDMEYTPPFSKELYAQQTFACDTVVSSEAAGKIVLIDRGTCAFVIKYEAAVKAGAAGVLICNNDTVNLEAQIAVTGVALKTNPIPMFSTSTSNCRQIKAALASSTLTGSIAPTGCPTPRAYDPAVFWGNLPGQGDFANGSKGDWVVNKTGADNETFAFYANNRPMTGSFNGGTATFTSPTACNGVAAYSFVKYNLLNNPTLAGPPYYNSSAELISPTIDCSGKNFIAMEFYMINHKLNGDVSYATSIDDGATWSEPVILGRTTIPASLIAGDKVVLSLLNFANQPKCKVKFIAEGDFYYFMLDDVTFLDKKVYEMEISNDYYGMAANYATPFNQGEEMPFTLDIENLGNAPVENIKVAVTVTEDGVVDPVYTDTIVYGTVAVGTRDADRVFEKKFTPEAKETEYEVSFELIGDSIQTTSESNDFIMSKNVYSKMPIVPALINGWTQATGSYYSAGNYYKVVVSEWPDGQPITLDKGYAAAYVNATAGSNATTIVTYDVYKWVDTNQDTILVQPSERTLLATGSAIIDGDVDTLAIELFDPTDETKKVVLPAGEHQLVVVVSLAPIDETGTRWFIGSTNPGQGDNGGQYNSYAAALGRVFDGYPVWTGSFFVEGTADDIDTRVLENTSLTVFSPLILQDVELVNTVAFDASLKFKAYPVPAVQDLTVEIAFEKVQNFANILIADMSGRIVHAEKYVNVQNRNLTVDVSRFAAGVYTLQVVTETGFNSQTFSVVR